MAIFSCLSHLTLLPPSWQILTPHWLSLSLHFTSLHSLSNRISTNPFIQRIHSTLLSLHSIDSQITFIWVPGHIGFPEHDAVDKAAKPATSLPKMTDYTRLPIVDHKNHYRSLILQQWNLFWKTQPQINCSAWNKSPPHGPPPLETQKEKKSFLLA